ncbi:MAG TPA: DUF3568 family protein [Roseimicrobium sp.]|nr:DUF3568 family protein [Roseimicrobium sp.]
MKKFIFQLVAVVILAVGATGCVRTVDGHVKGGVPFKKDKIVSNYERPVAQIFDAAKAVLAENGKLNREDRINNTIEAKVDTRTVWVRVSEVDPSVSQVTTQVRTKGGWVDIDLAAELDKQIALKLAR